VNKHTDVAAETQGEITLNQLRTICLRLLASIVVLTTLSPSYAAQDKATDAGAGTLNNATPSMDASTTPGTTGSDTASGAATAPQNTVLKGGVDHAEALPELDETLQVGKVYSDDLLLKGGTEGNGQWFYIPQWYAGTRHVDDAMIMYRYDYETGKSSTPMLKQLNRQDSKSGYQRDRNGGIWDYKNVPMIQHVESDFCNGILYLRKLTPVSGSDDRLVMKYDEVSISTDKRTNKIIQVVQQEQINTITSPLPGVLRVDVSVKSFGWDGKPKRQEQSVMMPTVVKPFEQTDQFQGKDLRPLFRDYLISHHLENLVPLDLAK
jgi:hypothetical protein